MIKSFGIKQTEDIYHGVKSSHARKLYPELHPKTLRLLDQLNAITKIESLRVPSGNNLEKLAGNYKDYWSIRINKQWRIVFEWLDGNPYDVDVVDYH